MTDTTLVVDFAKLQHASSEIVVALNKLESQLSDLEGAAAPLVASWEGSAQQAYTARQATWRQAAGDLATILGNIKRAVDDSAADYLNTEQRNTRLFE